MKTVDVEKARDPLARYARRAHREDESLVVVDDGKPIAVVVPLEGEDLESLSVSTNPQFVALIEASRRRCPPGGGISAEEMRRRLTPTRSKKPRSR